MESTIKYSSNDLLKHVHMYIDDKSFRELVKDHELDFHLPTFRFYVRRHIHYGVAGLTASASNSFYLQVFKHQVVQRNICNKNAAIQNSLKNIMFPVIRRYTTG